MTYSVLHYPADTVYLTQWNGESII